MTDTTELKVNWEAQKSDLQKRFALLTDNDLIFKAGKKEELLNKLKIKLGKTIEQLNEIITAH